MLTLSLSLKNTLGIISGKISRGLPPIVRDCSAIVLSPIVTSICMSQQWH